MSPETLMTDALRMNGRVSVGIDVVQISRIEESLRTLGERFVRRLFTDGEAAYALQSPVLAAERLAARFAAKEAALKAFSLADAGVNWRDIEVCRRDDGGCHLVFHGRAAQHMAQRGDEDIVLSLSHDGDYATAIVAALRTTESSLQPATQP